MRRHGLHQFSAPSSAQMCLRLVSRRGPHAINMGSAVATMRHHVTAFQSIQNWALDARVWCQARHWRLFLHLQDMQEVHNVQDHTEPPCLCWSSLKFTLFRIIHYWPKWDLTVPTSKRPSEGSSAKLVQLECTEASLAKHACIQVIPFHHELWYDVMGRPGSKKDLRSDMNNS